MPDHRGLELYILRHGIAEDGEAGQPDSARKLTKEGRDKLALVIERAKAAGVRPSVILTSPYVRAVETAQIAAGILGCDSVIETAALTPDSSPEAVWDEIRLHSGENAILLAGHEPLLGETIRFCVGVSRPVVDFKKGALAFLSLPEVTRRPAGLLVWLLTPKLSR